MKKFIDPIDVPDPKTGKEVAQSRTSVIYATSVVSSLVSIRCRHSTIQTTVNILLAKLADELKRNGITEYDPDAYEHSVANCTILLGSATAESFSRPVDARATQTSSGNDGSGTERVGRKATGTADKPANLRVSPTRASGKRD